MPRFSLRTLIVVMLLAGPLIAWAWNLGRQFVVNWEQGTAGDPAWNTEVVLWSIAVGLAIGTPLVIARYFAARRV
jgi:hypothetical protein